MSFGPREYLEHIRDEAQYLVRESQVVSREGFLADETKRRAFVRALEVIGEAVKRLPPELMNREASVDWRSIAAMRDRLIHGYFGVDYEIVWDAAHNKAPQLLEAIHRLLANG